LVLLAIATFTSYSQESINTTGGDVQNAFGTVNYTIGQIVYEYHYGPTGQVAEGVQQPFEISEVLGVDSETLPEMNIRIYPNPTSGLIVIENTDMTNINIELKDLNGKQLYSVQQLQLVNNLDISALPSGWYFLVISKDQKGVKTYKIQKN
jgi:hypothetical protein